MGLPHLQYQSLDAALPEAAVGIINILTTKEGKKSTPGKEDQLT